VFRLQAKDNSTKQVMKLMRKVDRKAKNIHKSDWPEEDEQCQTWSYPEESLKIDREESKKFLINAGQDL